MTDAIEHIGLLDDETIPLDEAALALASVDHPHTDLAPYRQCLADWSAQLLARAPNALGSHARAAALAEVLAAEAGLRGDTHHYDDPANADLIRVIDRRRGLPITLSIIYAAVARRVGWIADPLNVPGHVLVRLGREADAVILDPFDGGRVLDAQGLVALMARVLGNHATIEAEHLTPLSNRSALVRLLSNQATRARRGGDTARALALYERMTLVAPSFTGLWWERARLEQLSGCVAAARASLAAMLETTRDPALRNRIRAALAALARSIN